MLNRLLLKLKNFVAFFSHSLKTTLLFWFLTLSILPFAAVAWYGYIHTVQSVDEMQRNKLTDTSTLNIETLKSRFYEAVRDLQSWSQLRTSVEILPAMRTAFINSGMNISDFIYSAQYQKLRAVQPKTIEDIAKQYDYVYDLFLIDLNSKIIFISNSQ